MFNASQMQAWLRTEGASVWRADGAPWPAADALDAVTMTGATLDSRLAGPGILFVGVHGEETHGARYLAQALEAGSPAALLEGEAPTGSSAAAPVFVVDDGRAALAGLSRGYLSTFRPQVVGITGSNGKTTTKDLLLAAVGGACRVGANPGNLNSGWGLPLAVLGQTGQEDILVLEMGASRPGEIAELAQLVGPRIGCITNVAPAHLEGFGSVAGVVDTKAGLLDALPADGVCVLPLDDANVATLRARAGTRRVVGFGWSEDAAVRIDACRQERDGLEIVIDGELARLPIFGEANAWNVAAACAMALELGVDRRTALDGMMEARLSPHRSRVLTVAERVVVDDCYNANPSSVAAALRSLAAMPATGRRWAVLGAMAELGEDAARFHRETVALAHDLGIDRLVAVGESMEAAQASQWPASVSIQVGVEDLGAALAEATAAGDVLLFKGSRSVALERVLSDLRDALDPTGKRD